MGFHTYDVDRADALEAPDRFRHCSAEELRALLAPAPDAVVADVGSGTGFYADVIAPRVGRLLALDVQAAMHGYYREKGLPGNVDPATAEAGALPVADDALDAAYSTMTYHEFAGEAALAELARAVRPGGRVVTVDWTAEGCGADGPPVAERYALGDCVAAFEDAGFRAERAATRGETFVCVARNDAGGANRAGD